MCRPILCAACRVQALTRRQSYIAYRQKQWLSQSSWKAQDFMDGVLAGPRTNSSREDETQAPTSDTIPRGRYSGQPLGPRRILDELDEPNAENTPRGTRQAGVKSVHERPKSKGSASPDGRSKRKNGTHPAAPSTIPSDLWATYQHFCDGFAKPVDDHKVLKYLKIIGHEYAGTEGLRALSHTPTFRRRCWSWIVRICGDWARELTDGVLNTSQLPRPSQALLAMSDCFSDHNNVHPSFLWLISTTMTELQARESERSHQRTLDGVRELMRLWNLAMIVRASHTNKSVNRNRDEIDWHFLPDVAMFSESLQRTQRIGRSARLSFEQALQMLLPEAILEDDGQFKRILPNGLHRYEYHSAALVTLDLLHKLKAGSGGEETVKDYEPWMDLIETTFKSVGDLRIPSSLARKLETPDVEEIYRGVIQRFGLTPPDAKAMEQPKHAASRVEDHGEAHGIAGPSTLEGLPEGVPLQPQDIEEPPSNTTSPLGRFVNTCNKRLGRAREQQNLSAAQSVYSDVRAFSSKKGAFKLPQEVYEALLYTFLSLRNPVLATSAWNDMVNAGHHPRTKTYTIMMRGSQNVRNQDAMEQFWRQMRTAGLQPDRYAWTTRLFGLLRSPRHIDVGLRAMVEMGHEWITAARNAYSEQLRSKGKEKAKEVSQVRSSELLSSFDGDVGGVPRPDVVVLNSAISALAERNDDLIPKALHWGRSFGIEPDLTTYNVLINISMRRGLIDEAFKILQSMKARGLEADSTTWTVLLTALFKGPWLENMESEEAAEQVVNFAKRIDGMEGQGLDEKGYSLLIDRLLKLYNDPSAAQKVLNHMADRGVKPNTHLYTILMASYFEQTPPNFAAIESLWTNIQSENAGYGAVLDAVFYDRMIENYASYHEVVGTKPMLGYLEQMEKEGKRPSWRALEQVARALAGAGEWERLRHIVEKSRRDREGGPNDAMLFGQNSFWQFIQSTGLSVLPSLPSRNEDVNSARDRTHGNM